MSTAVLAAENIVWNHSGLREGLERLAAASGHSAASVSIADVPVEDLHAVAWLLDAPRTVGLEGSLRDVGRDELLSALVEPGGHIVTVRRTNDRPALFVVVLSEGFRCRIFGPRHEYEGQSTNGLVDVLLSLPEDDDANLAAAFGTLPGGKRVLHKMKAGDPYLRTPITIVSYRPDAASPLLALARHEGAGGHILVFSLATVVQLVITGIAAFTLGSAALDGVVDRGRVAAWVMISIVAVPFAWMSSLRLSRMALSIGASVKRRLLEGTFFIGEDILRSEGFSAQLARVNEASLLERVSVADAFTILSPLTMIGAAFSIFATKSAPGVPLIVAALVMLGATGLLAFRNARLQLVAYKQRTVLTSDVVDKVIGHRTRAVQENPASWHMAEDRRLLAYTKTVANLDSASALTELFPRIWTLISAVVLGTFFVIQGDAGDLFLSAVGVVLFAWGIGGLGGAADRAASILTAWRAVKDLLRAGEQRPRPERSVRTTQETDEWPIVLAASSLAFAYRAGARAIFSDASLRVRLGERILIEGPSGGGKTTLAKIVAGELRTRGGSILVCGLDPFSGSETQWRKLVASVPQFHENHIFSQTFAFNVDPIDGRSHLSEEAMAICEELELGPLLSKMPAGSAQLLGETGWQLSHGERSRVFIARALLQKAQLVILDESFAALDPVTMRTVVQCVRRRATTLMVIAHV